MSDLQVVNDELLAPFGSIDSVLALAKQAAAQDFVQIQQQAAALAAVTAKLTQATGEITTLEGLVPPRAMYDCATGMVGHLPSSAPIVVGGPKWTTADWALAPAAARKLYLAHVATDTTKDILDVEKGYASVADVPGFVAARKALGRIATIYIYEGNLPALFAATPGLVPGLDYYLWVANQTGFLNTFSLAGVAGCPAIPVGIIPVVATQWSGYPKNQALGYDISVVTHPLWPDNMAIAA